MGLDIAFWVLAIVAVAAALSVVLQTNVFRAALALVLCFVTVAGLYVTLSADFLAAIQILIYVGGISILIILGIMLTRDEQHGSQSNRLAIPAFLVAAVFLGFLIFTVIKTPWAISGVPPLAPTTGPLAETLLGSGGYILASQISAVLLLAAIIGAIVLVREK